MGIQNNSRKMDTMPHCNRCEENSILVKMQCLWHSNKNAFIIVVSHLTFTWSKKWFLSPNLSLRFSFHNYMSSTIPNRFFFCVLDSGHCLEYWKIIILFLSLSYILILTISSQATTDKYFKGEEVLIFWIFPLFRVLFCAW